MFETIWKCNNCGHVFADGEEKHSEEYAGECHGTPAYYQHSACPCCGSNDYDEAGHCDICDEVVLLDDLKGGACPKCWEKIKKHYEHSAVKMAKLFETENANIDLNPFIVWALNEDREKIEEILLNYLVGEEKRAVFWGEPPISYIDYLEGDEEETVCNAQRVGDIE